MPAFFVPNVFSFATEGKELHFGSIAHAAPALGARGARTAPTSSSLEGVEQAAAALLQPDVVLDILRSFTVFATDKKHRKIKIISRYQQYDSGQPDRRARRRGPDQEGPDLALPGLGQVAADGVRRAEAAAPAGASQPDGADRRRPRRPRHADHGDVQRRRRARTSVTTERREELQTLLGQGVRKIIITTIHKFGEAEGVLDDRDNIIVLVDEAHRTQEGDLGRRMREALPNAFLFGLTGTPINKRDRNTFWAFGAEEDELGYMSRYSFEESIRDGATLPLHFEPRLVDLHVDQEAIDEGFEAIAAEERLSETDKALLARRAGRFDRLVKAPERWRRSPPTSPSTSRSRSSRTASRRRSSSSTARRASLQGGARPASCPRRRARSS